MTDRLTSERSFMSIRAENNTLQNFQYHHRKEITEKQDTPAGNSLSDNSSESYSEIINNYISDMTEKIKNGETEKKIPIGNSVFTEKEWKTFLKNFDALEDALKKSYKEELKKRLKNKEYREKAEKQLTSKDLLFLGLANNPGSILKSNHTAAAENNNNLSEKISKMNSFLKSVGINGSVSKAYSSESNQSYTAYYVETNGAGKNMVFIELEDGRLISADTNLSCERFFDSFLKNRITWKSKNTKKKYTPDELINQFSEFFNIKPDDFTDWTSSFSDFRLPLV